MTQDTARIQAALDRFNKLAPTLREESDRAMAILGAAYLDDLLREGLLSILARDEVSEALFKGYGPLATFSARIDLSYALGLYGPGERRELHLVRKIRNEFAHGTEIHSFEQSPVSDWCRELSPYEQFAGRPDDPSLHHGSATRTAYFVTITMAGVHLIR